MSETVTIPARFNGPPASGHGGYSAGAVALLLGSGPAAASLRMPPPLETPMDVRRGDGTVELLLGEDVVARAEPAELAEEPPPPVTPEEAGAAEPDPHELAEHHPFPTCFGCGPLRDRSEALRLFAGPIAGADGLYGARWVPQPDLADADGVVAPVFVWAALDCPSAAPAMVQRGVPVVLARLAVDLERPVHAGEPHAVTSRLHRTDGRKRFTGVALYDARGTRLARGEALWIELRGAS